MHTFFRHLSFDYLKYLILKIILVVNVGIYKTVSKKEPFGDLIIIIGSLDPGVMSSFLEDSGSFLTDFVIGETLATGR